MFIGICGTLCAGKHEVANYLVNQHNFKILALRTRSPTALANDNREHIPSNVLNTTTPTTASPLPTVPYSHSHSHSHSSPALDSPITPESDPNSTVLNLHQYHSQHFQDGKQPNPIQRCTIWFFNSQDLLNYVTKRWTERFVTTDIWDEKLLEKLLVRPFFLLISVDAPVSIRWERYRKRCTAYNIPSPTLTEFVIKSDSHMFDEQDGLAPLINKASLKLVNPTNDVENLYKSLEQLDLTDERRLRPTWDAYFMQLAKLAAQRSNCMTRRVGCVLVRDKRVISTGYNGTPKGFLNCNEGGCPRCNSASSAGHWLSTCLCLHAEENALLEAGRERVGSGATLYSDTCPCLTCAIKIVQVGICEVVYSLGYSMDNETARVLGEGGVKLRQYELPTEGLVKLIMPKSGS